MVVELGRQVRGDHRSRLMFFQPAEDRANDTVILVERGAARDEADRVPPIDEVAELAIPNTQLLASDSHMNMGEEAAQNWAATASAVVRISAAVIGEAACTAAPPVQRRRRSTALESSDSVAKAERLTPPAAVRNAQSPVVVGHVEWKFDFP